MQLPTPSCSFAPEHTHSQTQTCTSCLPAWRLLLKHIGAKKQGKREECIDEQNIEEAPPQRAPK